MVLIPSYDRPEMLDVTLPRWCEAEIVEKIFIVGEVSSRSVLEAYQEVIDKHQTGDKITERLTTGRLGSVKARNILLHMAREYSCEYALMVDDDHLLTDENCLKTMVRDLESYSEIGAVGGKVIVTRQRMDPDFFLNLPINLADYLSRLIGYVFLDTEHGPRWSEFLPPFFMIKREVLDVLRGYDQIFDTPTGFREESDFQLQIRHLGYRLLYDSRVHVVHLAAEKGGNRLSMSMEKRMYWKARNHIVFLFKWNESPLKRGWYTFCSSLILSIYRPQYVSHVLRGLKEGMNDSL